jgi:hypothetical protein
MNWPSITRAGCSDLRLGVPLQSVLDEIRLRAPILSHFLGNNHSWIVEVFKGADREHLQRNAARVRREVGERLRCVSL